MEILMWIVVGALVWQGITLIAFALSGENEDVGAYFGMGLPLILTQLTIGIAQRIKWAIFRRRYRFYHFIDATLESYNQLRVGHYAKPADMQCFNFDTSASHYVVEKAIANKYRYVPHSDVLTKQDIQFGFPGMSAGYLANFKKD